jgi:hypothetical protein
MVNWFEGRWTSVNCTVCQNLCTCRDPSLYTLHKKSLSGRWELEKLCLCCNLFYPRICNYTGRSHFTRVYYVEIHFIATRKLHHFLNSRNNLHFTAVWHRRSVAAQVVFMRLAESDVTVTPSVICVD